MEYRQMSTESESYILIQGAMDTETAYLIERLSDKKRIQFGNWTFHCGYLGSKRVPVIISKTFQGMTNAAAAAALALSLLPLRAVINQGIAGGYDPHLHTGDVVIGEKVLPMGAVIRPFREKDAGVAELAFEDLTLEIFDRARQKTEKVKAFVSDAALVKAAQDTPFANRKITSVIGSADEWNNELDRIAFMHKHYGISCEDMESAAAAQMARSFNIPFIGIRILSNTILYHEELDESQGEVLQKFIEQFVQQL